MYTKQTSTQNNPQSNEDQDMNEFLEACIFNCTYVSIEKQLEDEQNGNKWNQSMIVDDDDNNVNVLDVVVSDSISDNDGTMTIYSMDEKSLLDVESSNSWESEK